MGIFGKPTKQNVSCQKPHCQPALPARAQPPPRFTFCSKKQTFPPSTACVPTELWHFYAGAPVLVHVIDPEGSYSLILLGSDPEAGQALQAVVRAGNWFASHVADWKSFALVGCTVAPGFDFDDFELGKRDDLLEKYPRHQNLIERLTRE